MQQIYYTQEGTPYVLKVQTNRFNYDFGGVADSGTLEVTVNGAMTGQSDDQFRLDIKTNNPIIPVMCVYGCNDGTASPIIRYADIMSVYYSFHEVTFNAISQRHLAPLTKMAALVDRIYFTDTDHYAYSLKYGQVVLTANDFIPVNGICGFKFKPFMSDAFDNDATEITIPALVNNTQIGISFLYFELQTS